MEPMQKTRSYLGSHTLLKVLVNLPVLLLCGSRRAVEEWKPALAKVEVDPSKNRKFVSRAFWATIVSPEGLKYAHCIVQLLLKLSMGLGVFFM